MTAPTKATAQDVATIARGLTKAGDDDRCPECGLLSCCCYDDEPYDSEGDEGWDECGMTPGGGCMLAGTEWCDWDCPRNKPSTLMEQSA